MPDGLKVDQRANLWATGPGGVLIISPEGKHLGTLATGVAEANCAWGEDGSTLFITAANDTQAAQDAVDRELVARYRPGQQRERLLVQLVERIGQLQDVADRSRHDVPSAPLSAVARRVTFPYGVWRLADVRWQDLGYRSLSAYVTGLIRYDLLVSGPHSTITADCRSKIQRALTRKTLAVRRKGRRTQNPARPSHRASRRAFRNR